MLLSMPEPMKYADQSNMPWVRLETLPQLTHEEFADRLGGIVDGIERTGNIADQECDISPQRVLSGIGGLSKDGGTGREPGRTGVSEGDGVHRGGGHEAGGRVLAFRTGGQSRPSEAISRRLVALELKEHLADLKAFQDAYACVHKRVQAVKDEGQLMKLVNWSGTSAVMGSLDMSIHAIENVIEELKHILFRIDNGLIADEDQHDG